MLETQEKGKVRYIVRLMNTDLDGNKPIYHALNKIHGISYSFANVICNVLDLDKSKKAGIISQEEIKNIEDVIKNPDKYNIPAWMFNRRKDVDTGKDMHIVTSELDLKKENDIKNLKKIKSYRGIRHSMGLPTRGQRTRAHFRKGVAIGVQRKKALAQSKSKEEKK